jgi:hypothetical protein
LCAILEWDTFRQLSLQQGSRAIDLLRYCRSIGGYSVVAELMAKQLWRWGGGMGDSFGTTPLMLARGASPGGDAANAAHADAIGTLEWLERTCVLANFLVEAGESEHATRMCLDAIEVADDAGAGRGGIMASTSGSKAMTTIIAAALGSAEGARNSHQANERIVVVAEVVAEVGAGMGATAALEAARLLKLVASLNLALAEALTIETIFKEHREHENLIIPALERAIGLWRWLGEGDERDVDRSGMGQALTTLCYWLHARDMDVEAEAAGQEAIRVFSSIGNPRLAQAEQHMAQVLEGEGRTDEAMAMYKQSVATFERMGTATIDTEYACSISQVAVLHARADDFPRAVAWTKRAVVSCEAIKGRGHTESEFYRRQLVSLLFHSGSQMEAFEIQDGAEVQLLPAEYLAAGIS